MVDPGDRAPDFTRPKAGGTAYNDVEPLTLSEALADGPVVLAFYPAAFTGGCEAEMCTFRDAMPAFEAVDAQVYGISVDLPVAQNVWIADQELNVPMVSDWDHQVIRLYDTVRDDLYGMFEVAERSVFVVDTDRTVAFRWMRENGNPDFDDLVARTRDAVADL